MDSADNCTNELISEYANDVDSCSVDELVCDECNTDECNTDEFTDSTDHITEVLKNLAGKAHELSEYECNTPSDNESEEETNDQINPSNKDVLKVVSEMRVDMLQAFQLLAELNKEIMCIKKAIKSVGCGTGNVKARIESLESASDYSDTINDGLSKIQNEFEIKMDLMKKEIEEKVTELIDGIQKVNRARYAGHAANSKETPAVKVTIAKTKTSYTTGQTGVGYFQ